MDKTVFLDRDGTIIVDKHYLSNPDEVELIEGAGRALFLLQSGGYRLVVVTNQSGVGRGYFSLADVGRCNDRISELLSAFGVTIDAWFVCPHMQEHACSCRKPLPGLINQARDAFSIDDRHSFVIGDKDIDVMLGRATGMRGLLVLTGSGVKYLQWAVDNDHLYFSTIADAARYILDCSKEPACDISDSE